MTIDKLRVVSSHVQGYLSPTGYDFRNEHSQAIIRVASYHRKDFRHSVIHFPLQEHDNVRPSMVRPFQRDSPRGIGTLYPLPLHLLHAILLHLDVCSLFRLRQTNSAIRQVVDSINEYQQIATHGLEMFCALLRTRVAARISLLELWQMMRTKECAFCGDFAVFITLLVWKRCCFTCLRKMPQTQAQTRNAVQEKLRLTNTQSRQLKSLLSLPGVYTLEEAEYKNRFTLVSISEATALSKEPDIPAIQTTLASSSRARRFIFMAACTLPVYDKWTGKVDHGVACAGCQSALENDIIGSRGEDWAFAARDTVYAENDFLAHFRWCQQAQLLWESSDEGRQKPPALPEAARRNGYFGKVACR